MSDVLAAAVADSSARVLAVAEGLDEATLRSSSQLPNWSVGNVLAHIALNAEAFTRVAEERRAGRPGVMYPDGVPGRNADIAELGDAPAAVLIARLSDAIAHFAEAWADPVPVGPCVTAVGMNEFSSVEVIARRLREVEVHGSDTGLETLNHTTWSDAPINGPPLSAAPTLRSPSPTRRARPGQPNRVLRRCSRSPAETSLPGPSTA
jgi:maleylpyruvate isomerase